MNRHTFNVLCVAFLAAIAGGNVLHAQNTPVVFLHGLNAGSTSWQDAADRLAVGLSIQPYRTDSQWRQSFQTQADNVQSQVGSLPSSTIAIGHSNGGLVARQWSRTHPLSAIITIGTPHQGAPLITNLAYYGGFDWSLVDAVSHVFQAFSDANFNCAPGDFHCGLIDLDNLIGGAIAWAGAVVDEAWLEILGSLGLELGLPVIEQMRVGSGFMNDINSSSNLSREASQIPTRIGIASEAYHFFDGGPIRAMAPHWADDFVYIRGIVIWVLDYYGFDLITDPSRPLNQHSAGSWLTVVASILEQMDYAWAVAVSYPAGDSHFGTFASNDTIVPVWSQNYQALGAAQLFIQAGPVHAGQEPNLEAGAWERMTEALVNYASVPPRPGPMPVHMYQNAAVRGCANYSEWAPVWEPDADSCLAYCHQNNADACEWSVSGGCYAEFGDGCNVEQGYDGWYAYVLSPGNGGGSGSGRTPADMQQDSAVRGCENYSEMSPVYQPDPPSCRDYCIQSGANACEWADNGSCYVEFGSGCSVQAGFPGWYALVLSGLPVAAAGGNGWSYFVALTSALGLLCVLAFRRKLVRGGRRAPEWSFAVVLGQFGRPGRKAAWISLVVVLFGTSASTQTGQKPSLDDAMRRKIEALESTQAQLQSNIKSIERQLTEIRTMLQAGGVPRGPVQLPVPKEPISLAGAAVKGDSTAKLVIVEYSDFQCPYCASFVRQTLPMLEKTYISTGKASLAFRNLPIAEIHPQAVKAAETAECARRQGKFWEMHDRLFLDQAGLEDVALVRRGQSLGLDPAASNRCFSGDAAAKIRQEVAEAKELQIMSTPSFFIGLRQSDGRVQVLQRLNGNQPYSTFASALDGILSAAASRK